MSAVWPVGTQEGSHLITHQACLSRLKKYQLDRIPWLLDLYLKWEPPSCLCIKWGILPEQSVILWKPCKHLKYFRSWICLAKQLSRPHSDYHNYVIFERHFWTRKTRKLAVAAVTIDEWSEISMEFSAKTLQSWSGHVFVWAQAIELSIYLNLLE